MYIPYAVVVASDNAYVPVCTGIARLSSSIVVVAHDDVGAIRIPASADGMPLLWRLEINNVSNCRILGTLPQKIPCRSNNQGCASQLLPQSSGCYTADTAAATAAEKVSCRQSDGLSVVSIGTVGAHCITIANIFLVVVLRFRKRQQQQ